jgi:hypothetical protein
MPDASALEKTMLARFTPVCDDMVGSSGYFLCREVKWGGQRKPFVQPDRRAAICR